MPEGSRQLNDSATTTPRWPLLYRWDYLVLSIGPSSPLRAHSHGAAELRISMEAPISCLLKEGREIEASSILIPPGVQHQNRCEDEVSSVLYLDVESRDYTHLTNRMSREGPVYTGLPNLLRAQQALAQTIREVPDLDDCLEHTRRHIVGAPSAMQMLDARVSRLVRHLKNFPADASPVGALAASVGLSEDRLHHLFSNEVGIPIHRFRLWIRLKHASHLFLDGHSLTFAAYESGFADSAHFTRTFVRMFGAPPSRLLTQHRQS